MSVAYRYSLDLGGSQSLQNLVADRTQKQVVKKTMANKMATQSRD